MWHIKCTYFFNSILILTIALLSNNYPCCKFKGNGAENFKDLFKGSS